MNTDTLSLIIAETGWLGFLLSLIFAGILLAITPAWKFLRAKIKGVPMILTQFKDQYSEFRPGTKPRAEATKIDQSHVHLTNSSHMIDKKSKVPLYFHFSGHGITDDPLFNATLSELREMGFKFDNYEELKLVVDLVNDKTFRDKYMAELKDQNIKKQLEETIKKAENTTIEIKSYKTYKFQDIKNFYPFNINSDYSEAITEEEVTLALKKSKAKENIVKMLVVLGVVFAVVGGVIIIFTMVYDPKPKQVICQFGTNAIKAGAATAIQNMTI
jgi:hypothetical protein